MRFEAYYVLIRRHHVSRRSLYLLPCRLHLHAVDNMVSAVTVVGFTPSVKRSVG